MPVPTGSLATANTMGMTDVTCFAAWTSRLPASSRDCCDNPVTLPPGRARLAVSQRRKEPNTRPQASFDRTEGESAR